MSWVKRCLVCLLTLFFISGCASTPIEKKGEVYYEIFVRSFYDSNGDGIGDLKGVESKLDYLDDLGISGIWLMPIHPSPSYHKYDVSDYLSVDESYGSMDDLESLINHAKEKNIDIILDLVLNHTSYDHPWFVAAKEHIRNGTCEEANSYCDYYNFTQEYGDGYAAVPGSTYYYEARFSEGMPDLNLDSENVREEIRNIVDFYMNKGIKGFRLDATLHYYENDTNKNIEFLSWFSDLVKSYDEDAFIVSEAWSSRSNYSLYYKAGVNNFDFDASSSAGLIVNAIRNEDGQSLANSFVDYTTTIKDIDDKALNCVFLSNHDQGRSGSYLNDLNSTKFAASLYLLMPGVPFIYYGEEIGMLGSGSDPNKRMSFMWSDENTDGMTSILSEADYSKRRYDALDVQMKDQESLYAHYKKVLAIRNRYAAFVDGRMYAYENDLKELYASRIESEDEELLIIHNFSKEDTLTIDVEGYTLCDVISIDGGSVTLEKHKLSLDAHCSAILVKG